MNTPPASVHYIHVLGSGHVSNPKFPLSSQLEINGLVRVIEGIRLYKLSKQCKLIFSGYAGKDPISEAQINGKMAMAMGVSPSDIILLDAPRDTFEEAIADKTISGNETVILVTSASHMPRAKTLFEKAGVRVIPAPTDFEAKKREPYWKFPSAEGLECSEKAFHEYFGLIWGRLSGIL
ncbi:ElyC/SanA/YdcF family protein [Sulfuricurvum sp.]|uniref:YdcF family protein n=1 Tax=Sulfuricurvum sp. TaxID=2025608 RepID=UPI002607A59C|nr:ElyC/SanA/YdcF family protein [Sulfuricurvum sp.]MDD2265568.1 ElyC/SanA/YdcF family protein [Sulfuricurvum sp.]MDD2783820.1 ElyC/SanA/YdcF family protein [Sulfuricurvum sp.]